MKRSIKKDKELLDLCFAGDEQARDKLVLEFSNLVYQVILHTFRVKNVSFEREDVEDLHNSVFLKLFEKDCRKLRQYKGKNGCSLATWIRLVASGIALDHLRRTGVDSISCRRTNVPLDDVFNLAASGTDSLRLVEEAEKRQLFQKVVETLSPQYRLFVKLHFEREQPLPRVATALRLSMNNVYALKHRVKEKIRAEVTVGINSREQE